MPNVCVDDFVDSLSRNRLLEPAQMDDLGELGHRFTHPKALAQELIRRGWLTPFQVNQLFLGRGDNLVLGQYFLLERLGEGGMGQVFKGQQRNLNRVVALKVIRKEFLLHANAVPRFKREIQALAQLSHPNIVHAFDADEVNGTYYFAMEYVDGVDLNRLVKETGPLEIEQACDYIRQAALGLQHAFERGMVHRDIKPANLLVTNSFEVRGSGVTPRPGSGIVPRPASGLLARPSSSLLARPSLTAKPNYPWGLVKLLDLGLAKWDDNPAATALTQLGSIMGTPDFIAPEQARDSRHSDIRADIYSLGCTLYFLLCGQIPFPEGTITEKLMHHQFDDPQPVDKVRRARFEAQTKGQEGLIKVPSPVKALLKRLLAKRPEDRPQTPGEVAQVLNDLAQRGALKPGGAAEPVSTEEDDTIIETEAVSDSQAFILRAPPKAGRKKRRGVLIGVGCLLGLGLAAALGLSRLPGRPPTSEPPPPKKDVVLETALDSAWRKLQARAAGAKTKPDAFRADLLAFRQQFPGSPQAIQAAAWLAALPSALDRIDDARFIPKLQRFAWQPLELIAILGDRWDKKSRMPLAIAFSPDGKCLATGSEDNNSRLWDMSQLPRQTVLSEHASRVHSVAFSPDGQVLATGGGDGAIVLWDAQGKMQRRHDAHQGGVMALAFSPAGRTLASAGGDGRVVLWADPVAGTDAIVLEGGAGRMLCLGFAPDATTLIAGGTGSVLRWWKLSGAEPVAKGTLPFPTGWAKVAAFSPDGKTLVCGGGNGTLYVCDWDNHTPKVRAVLDKHQQRVNDIAFAPDGKTFASGSDDASVKLWDTATGRVVKEWSDLRFAVNGVSFAPDGRHIAIANANSTVYLLRLGTLTPASK